MEELEGYIEHIVFHNNENGYTVMKIISEGEEIYCVGTLHAPQEGIQISLKGRYITHNQYGEQFQIESYVIKEPEDSVAIERYLASGVIKGIGAALAARIVRRFKEDTFRIMEEEPERLSEVKGISQKMCRHMPFW